MKKHVPMNPAWFEPGADGVNPFVRKYKVSPGGVEDAISAAFRALIAQEQATEPPALQVGDVVRLERYEFRGTGFAFFEHEANLVGTEQKISDIDEDGDIWVAGTVWPLSALTLVRRAGEPAPVDADAKDAEIAELRAEVYSLRKGHAEAKQQRDKFWSQRDAARAEVERLCEELSRVINISADRVAERDALQARIDAGVRVWGENAGCLSNFADFAKQHDTHTALLIDARPIAEADERTGERRKMQFVGHVHSVTGDRMYPCEGGVYKPASRTFPVNRRRNAGTIADRGKVS